VPLFFLSPRLSLTSARHPPQSKALNGAQPGNLAQPPFLGKSQTLVSQRINSVLLISLLGLTVNGRGRIGPFFHPASHVLTENCDET
jgi:hypothetical protein